MKIVFSEALTAHYDEVKEDTQFARILEERSWDNKIVAYIIFSDLIDSTCPVYSTWDYAPNGASTVYQSKYARIQINSWRTTSEALELAKRLCFWLVDMDYESEEESEDSEYYEPLL